jgi:hypothetical protein
MEALLELTWQTQVVLVSGYFAYLISNTGKRAQHNIFDTSLIILAFGGIGLLVIKFVQLLPCKNEFLLNTSAAALAVVSTIAASILWHRVIKNWTGSLTRYLSGNKNDGLLTAWDNVVHEQRYKYSELIVTLKNGKVFESYPLGKFNGELNGPCVLGADGSIAMYVTRVFDDEYPEGRLSEATVNDDGARITYLPADSIAEIDIRRTNEKV